MMNTHFLNFLTQNMLWSRYLTLCIATLFFGLWHINAYAHKPSDSYLSISIPSVAQQIEQTSTVKTKDTKIIGTKISAQWDIALRDLDYAIGLDANANAEITWQEVSARQQQIYAYALARLNIASKQTACDLKPKKLLIDNHTDGAYAVIQFSLACKQDIPDLSIRYSLFSDIDPSHRGLLKLNYITETSKSIIKTAIFGPDNPVQTFVFSTPDRLNEFKEYVVEGIWHIWIGYDHILFLISLLLPAVLVYSAKGWQPSQSFKTTFMDVLKVVTAFTIAHSITLTLATLQIVELPTRWVETAIAASVNLAALNNLFPYLLKYRWLAAFGFGLIHGFGFASVLADLGLESNVLMLALIGFNVGVEIGQIGIVCLFVPGAYALRKTLFYKHIIFVGGSTLIALLASIWFAERAFNLTVLSSIVNSLRI